MPPSARRWQRHALGPGLWLHQPEPGYRAAMDPILLAGWIIERGTPRTAVDAGSGSGILALLLGRAGAQVVGVDAQAEWLEPSTRSAEECGLSQRVRFETADLRTWVGPEVDLVASNPPYFTPGSGHVPADPMRAHARHALRGDLAELIPRMTRLAPRIALVLPTAREAEARSILADHGRPVVAVLRLLPRIVLLEGRTGGGPVSEETLPLRTDGVHHPRAHALYAAAGAYLKGARTQPQTQ